MLCSDARSTFEFFPDATGARRCEENLKCTRN